MLAACLSFKVAGGCKLMGTVGHWMIDGEKIEGDQTPDLSMDEAFAF